MYRHGLYVIGARIEEPDSDVTSAPLGMFAVERFSEAEHLRAHGFQFPANAPLREVLHGAFGPHLPEASGGHDVVVEFSAEKAHLVSSREWHPTQHVTALASGRIRLAFRAPSLAPIVTWVLEWGPHARVIAPDALVDQVVRELDGARRQYG